MYAFWAILLIIIAVRLYWKHSANSRHANLREAFFGKRKKKPDMPVTGNAGFVIPENLEKEGVERKAQKEAEEAKKIIDKQRERDIADLRKQGYDDELIAVIIPTINNGE